MQSSDKTRVEISEELLKQLEQVADVPKRVQFSPEIDAAILKYYDKKQKEELAKVLGLSRDAMRKRYKDLIKEQDNA